MDLDVGENPLNLFVHTLDISVSFRKTLNTYIKKWPSLYVILYRMLLEVVVSSSSMQ